MRGGAAGSGVPVGNRNALRHGGRSAETLALRRWVGGLLRGARELTGKV